MELDQIFSDSFGYAKSSWGKIAMLGAIILVTFIIWIIGAFVSGIAIGATNSIAIAVIIWLVLIIITILAVLIYYGYLYRVIKATLAEINELPNFDDFTSMMVDGLKVLVVWIVYAIIFGIIMAVIWGIVFGAFALVGGFTSMFMSPYYYSDPSAMFGSGIMFWVLYLVMFIAYLVTIAVAYLFAIVVPMGIANMAREGSIGAAFSIGAIRNRISNIRWLKVILWVVGLFFIFGIAYLVSAILFLLLIGIIVVPLIVVPFLSILAARSAALLYIEGE